MAILEILEAPHPLLEQKARDVRPDEFGPALEAFVRDLAETMYAAPGVGLAAPQVGDLRRVLVADPAVRDENGKKETRFVAMINPRIVETEGRIVWEESCLSVPEFDVDVERHRRVRVEWRTPGGLERTAWFDEFPSIVVQHEMDHLEGITLLERASRLKRSRYMLRRRKAAKRPPGEISAE